jgi:hypothetical protein
MGAERARGDGILPENEKREIMGGSKQSAAV